MIIQTGKTFFIPQPRILFKTGTDRYALKASWGRMGQYLHTLTNTGLGIPTDLWLTSTDRLRPEVGWTASLGQFFITKKGAIWGVEGFYKRSKNLTRYGTGLLRLDENSDWEENIPQGNGLSYGVEASYTKTIGKSNILGSYTLSWSERSFDDINAGEPFRFRYDRRHVANLSVIRSINENIEVSANWEFGSGTPITIPSTSSYNYIDEENDLTRVRVFSSLNNDQLPAYHRLDFGFNFYNDYKWGKSKFTLGVYNAYGNINPFFVDEITNPDLTVRYEHCLLYTSPSPRDS